MDMRTCSGEIDPTYVVATTEGVSQQQFGHASHTDPRFATDSCHEAAGYPDDLGGNDERAVTMGQNDTGADAVVTRHVN